MLIGYARVSIVDQNLNLQIDALTQSGCDRIVEVRQSGARADRPGLKSAFDYARPGDVHVVWRLDHLSRSLKDLIEMVGLLESMGVGLKVCRNPSIRPLAPGSWSSAYSVRQPSLSAT